jgi:hypothetical protein
MHAQSLMHRDRVIEAIEEVCRKEFRGLVVPAILAAKTLILNNKHPNHPKVVNSLLSRLGFAERSGVDLNVTGEVTVSHTGAAVEDLRRCMALGFIREQLVGAFGWSGLERYESRLKNAQPKLIEYDATPAGPDTPGVIEPGAKPDDDSTT